MERDRDQVREGEIERERETEWHAVHLSPCLSFSILMIVDIDGVRETES